MHSLQGLLYSLYNEQLCITNNGTRLSSWTGEGDSKDEFRKESALDCLFSRLSPKYLYLSRPSVSTDSPNSE